MATASSAADAPATAEAVANPLAQQQLTRVPTAHTPSLAGSVLEVPNGIGGKTLIRIQNISCTANLSVRLDLKRIALKCRNTEFNPRRFCAVIMKLQEPSATALIFSSGKMCVTGVKSTHNAQLAAKKFAYIIERVGFKHDSLDFKVQNIVGTADVGFPIRLEGLVYAHSTFASYEPELFPGLIYRLVSPRVVFLIFVSGKIVITGAKTEGDLSQAFTKMYPVLVEYRKVHVAALPGVPANNNNNTATGANNAAGGVGSASGSTTQSGTSHVGALATAPGGEGQDRQMEEV